MNSTILISAPQLNELIGSGLCVVVDCRFDLTNPAKGRATWLSGHIPGAFYAHLDDDLAAPVQPDSGRHPLPDVDDFSRYLASIGWTDKHLLVAYDDGSNAISSRLWWLMHHFGKEAALLDGGLTAWKSAGLPLESGEPLVDASAVAALEDGSLQTVSSGEISGSLDSGDLLVLDARALERYAGETEPLDTEAGHIPGALSRPFSDNLQADGRFLDPEALRAQFEELLGDAPPERIVHSCGSGVTACHNLFAMELAGLGNSRLYPGSWSEWIRDPSRPIRQGRTP